MQQVEGVEVKATVLFFRQERLEIMEAAGAIRPERDQFTVEQCRPGREGRKALGETRHATGPIVAVARDKAYRAVIQPDQQAITVELEL